MYECLGSDHSSVIWIKFNIGTQITFRLISSSSPPHSVSSPSPLPRLPRTLGTETTHRRGGETRRGDTLQVHSFIKP